MIVTTQGLTKHYRSQVALDGVDLVVPTGSVFGIVGSNGAGKTTLLSIIAGLRRATSGHVSLSVDRARIAVCPDHPEFEPWLTATEVVQLAASLVGHPLTLRAVADLLAEAGLSEAASRAVGGFSRGMTQRLAVVTTIVAEPALVILDEPCAALDPAGRVEVLDLVRRVADRSTVIFSSHVLADVERVCDQVAVMRGGKVVRQGAMTALLDDGVAPTWTIRTRVPATSTMTSAMTGELSKHDWVESAEMVDATSLRVIAHDRAAAEMHLVRAVADLSVPVVAIEPNVPTLEHVFLRLTGEEGP